MSRATWLEETKQMRFEEAYEGWQAKRLTQEEAPQLLGVCERSFRRYVNHYDEAGLEGLIDKRLHQVSHRKAPTDEVLRLEALYKEQEQDGNVKHFFDKRYEGQRSYTWVKKTLKAVGTGAFAWDADSPGWLDPPLGAGCILGLDRHHGRCD